MFENFVIFTEVTKLSSNMYYNLQIVNYSDKFAIDILWKEDTVVFEKLIDLVEDRRLVISNIVYILKYYVSYIEYEYLDLLFRLKPRDLEFDTVEDRHFCLTMGCLYGHLDLVKYFIYGEVSRNIKSHGLCLAAEHGQLEIVKYLIQEGANVNYDYDFGKWSYSLEKAARYGHFEIVKYLVENGADMNLDNGNALIWSLDGKHLQISKYLIDNRSNLHSEENNPLKYAVEHNILEIVKYLVKKKVYTKQFLEEVSTIANNDSTKYLVKQKMKY